MKGLPWLSVGQYMILALLVPKRGTFACYQTMRRLRSQKTLAVGAANMSTPSSDPPLTPKKRKRSPRVITPSPKKLPLNNPTTTNNGALLTSELLARVNVEQDFVDLKVPPQELRPSATLTTGQCFHWIPVVDENETSSPTTSAWGTHDATEWVGTLRVSKKDSVVLMIRETPTTTLYRPLTLVPKKVNLSSVLYRYFQLDIPLVPLVKAWSTTDDRLSTIAECIPGVRVLDQDPWECLISFICSSNNNIPRITKMLANIRRMYGDRLLSVGDYEFYSFPSLEELQEKATDEAFRQECGLGYRSKYILETMSILMNLGGEDYLHSLRSGNDANAVQDALCQFCGVGRKVADCVALFSLRQTEAIPVDTHVWNIARRDYDPTKSLANVKSLTPTTYRQVGDLFRQRFAQHAGWAHSLLFVAELPSFRPILPEHIVQQMDDFKRAEQEQKRIAKEQKGQR